MRAALVRMADGFRPLMAPGDRLTVEPRLPGVACEMREGRAILTFRGLFDGEGPFIRIGLIDVPRDRWRRGDGTRLLRRALAVADALALPVSLHAEPLDADAGGAGLAALAAWYGVHGFLPLPSQPHPEDACHMRRPPRPRAR